MTTTNDQATAPATDGSAYLRVERGSPCWLGRWRGLIIAGAVTAAVAALALSQHWLAVADLVRLLFVLPCAVMMFVCMKGMNHGRQADAAPTTAHNETLTTIDPRN